MEGNWIICGVMVALVFAAPDLAAWAARFFNRREARQTWR